MDGRLADARARARRGRRAHPRVRHKELGGTDIRRPAGIAAPMPTREMSEGTTIDRLARSHRAPLRGPDLAQAGEPELNQLVRRRASSAWSSCTAAHGTRLPRAGFSTTCINLCPD